MQTSPPKSLLGLRLLDLNTIERILNRAKEIKSIYSESSDTTGIRTLSGKTILTLFFEPSTRTRVSFETAIKRLGGSSVSINLESSSVKKGETLFDTIKNLDAMGFDAIIVRHKNAGVPHFIDRTLSVPVINAGDGFNEHPSQGLLDTFTMIESRGSLEKQKVLILGDILHSRVARSNLWILKKMGAEVFVSGPPTLMPSGITELGVTVVSNIDAILPQMDFINVLRVQYERQDLGYFPSIREYRDQYGLTGDRVKLAKKNVCILHPGPINRGSEIDSVVADGTHSVILDQVSNGIFIRMAILDLLLNPERPKG